MSESQCVPVRPGRTSAVCASLQDAHAHTETPQDAPEPRDALDPLFAEVIGLLAQLLEDDYARRHGTWRKTA